MNDAKWLVVIAGRLPFNMIIVLHIKIARCAIEELNIRKYDPEYMSI